MMNNSYVRPYVESAMQAYQIWLKRDLEVLEKPQGVATANVKGSRILS